MLIELPPGIVALLNVVGWPLIQLGWAWVFTRLPARWFERPRAFARAERGALYEKLFAIKRWKDRLPDGAKWFTRGFPKSALKTAEPHYLRQFIAETRRGELCHWAALACASVFVIWNPPWAIAVMVGVGALLNLPCILVQRYNRIRHKRVLDRRVTTSS